jgi:hypothetical protein
MKVNKTVFNVIGWILLLAMGVSWIVFGYSSWYLLLLPLSYMCFSISDGSIKKFKKIRKMSIPQGILILFAFFLSVGIGFGLLWLSSYLINDILHLTGWIKTFGILIAIIILLYPVKFAFWGIVYKVNGDLNKKDNT